MKVNYDYDKIFHTFVKYRAATYNNIMAYDNSIFQFKERVRGFNKILREMEIKPLSKKNNEPVEIFIKEDNKKKIYEDQSQSDKEPIDSKEGEDSEEKLKKTNSEPNLIIGQESENKNPLTKDKVFIVLGGFKDIINALIKRGWAECQNPDPKIFNYSFLYTLKIADIPFTDLGDDIIVNHFRKIGEITRKAGLLKNLRSLYYMGISPDDFYPRGYDLSAKQDVEDFIEDFKTSKAIALLRNCKELNGVNVNREEIITSLNIVKKKLDLLIGKIDLDKKFINVKQRTFSRTYDKNEKLLLEKISDKDWEIISNENMDFYREQMENIKRNGLYPKEKVEIIPTPKIKPPNKNANTKASNAKLKKKIENKPENKISHNKNEFIKSEEDKKLEEEIKKDFKIKEKERQIEKEKLDKIIQKKRRRKVKI